MIKEYLEPQYYAIVKVRAHKSYTQDEAHKLVRGIYAGLSQNESCIDLMLESPKELIWAFEGEPSTDRFVAECQERSITCYLQGALPEGWEII